MAEMLRDTSTSYIARRLVRVHETTAQTTGRVLTLIVPVTAREDIEALTATIKDASREHPARVIMLIDAAHGGAERNGAGDDAACGVNGSAAQDQSTSYIDAEIHLGGDAGASELIIITMHGAVAEHPDAVVTPLLLPDTPIVCWWPGKTPQNPGASAVGALAQRRIVDSKRSPDPGVLSTQLAHYTPGDSDMAWARITLWRGILASTLDTLGFQGIYTVEISGPENNTSVELAAGWLAHCLRLPVTRAPHSGPGIRATFRRATVEGTSEKIVVDQRSFDTVEVTVPGKPTSLVAINERSLADCLSEELRHLDPDATYAGALDGVTRLLRPREVVRVAGLDELADQAARRADAVVADTQQSGRGRHGDGFARVVLTGGSAGIAVLEHWAELYVRQSDDPSTAVGRVDWSRVHVFFGDERNVPVAHPESNEGQARQAFLTEVGVPENHIHGWNLGERPLAEAVADYADTLESVAPHGFDLHFLGVGPEGHVNSIFPHTAGIDTPTSVLAVTDSPKSPAERATLTLTGTNTSERVWLFAAGAQKAEAAAAVARDVAAHDWPAAGARGKGETLLFVDDAAAASL